MTDKEIRTGQVLGDRYTLLSLIARGGMGEVWRARDALTGRLVAAKVLRSELVGEEVSLSRLRLEAQNAMRAKHPNIAAVLDSGESNSQGWLIMEMVDGEPLTSFIGDGLTLTPGQLIPLLTQTAYALDAAARAGVVHRDIKPANILVKQDGRVKLTDFGVSFSSGQANLTAAGMVMGTAQYLPPEQALGNVATPSGDLYALGVIAYEALVGERPFTGASQVDIAFAHVNEAVPPLPSTVPKPLADLVFNLLAKDPANRPATGAALARELNLIAADLGLSTLPEPLPIPQVVPEPAEQPQTPRRRPTRSEVAAAPSRSSQAATVAPVSPAPLPKRVVPTSPSDGRWHPIAAQHADQVSAPPSSEPAGSEASDAPASSWGLWVIVGLVALTIVLIIFAMLRNHGVIGADPAAAILQFQKSQEVQLWLVTNPAV